MNIEHRAASRRSLPGIGIRFRSPSEAGEFHTDIGGHCIEQFHSSLMALFVEPLCVVCCFGDRAVDSFLLSEVPNFV
jgi:hypothetical protein